MYGDPQAGDERVMLNFGADGSTRMAIPSEDAQRPWFPLSRWRLEEDVLTFSDSRSERDFSANLNRPALGGEWRTAKCSEAGGALTPTRRPRRRSTPIRPDSRWP